MSGFLYSIISFMSPFLKVIENGFNSKTSKTQKKNEKRGTVMLALLVLSISLIIAYEHIWGVEGADYQRYRYRIANAAAKSLDYIIVNGLKKPFSSEVLWLLYEKMGASLFSSYDAFHLFEIIVILFFVFAGLKQNCENWWFAIWMWVTWGSFRYINNVTSELTAVAFLFYFGTKYLKEKSFFKYAAVCIIASMLHTSCIFFIVFYFFYAIDWGAPEKIILPFFSVSFLLCFKYIIPMLSGAFSKYSLYSDYGTNYTYKVLLIPLTLTAVIIYLSHYYKSNSIVLRNVNIFKVLLFYDLMWATSLINSISVRFTYLSELYVLIILSDLISELKGKQRAFAYILSAFFCLFCLWYFRLK